MPAIIVILFTLVYSLLAASPQVAQHVLTDRLARLDPHGKVKVTIVATPPIGALGGQLETFGIDVSHGMFGGVPFDNLAFVTGEIHYNPLDLLFDHMIVLAAPLRAAGSVDLSDAGFTKLLQVRQIQSRLENFPAPSNLMPGFGKQPHIDLEPRQAHFLDNGTVEVSGLVTVPEIGLALPFTASARPVLLDPDHVTIADPEVDILGNRLTARQLLGHVPLPVFDLDRLFGGIQLHIDELVIRDGHLHAQGRATVDSLPELPPAIRSLIP